MQAGRQASLGVGIVSAVVDQLRRLGSWGARGQPGQGPPAGPAPAEAPAAGRAGPSVPTLPLTRQQVGCWQPRTGVVSFHAKASTNLAVCHNLQEAAAVDAAIQLSLIEQAAAAKVQQRKNVRFAAKLPAAPQDRQKQPRGICLLFTASSTSSEVSTSGCFVSASHASIAPEVRRCAAGAAKRVPKAKATPARGPTAGASIAAAKQTTKPQAPRAAASKRVRQEKQEAAERPQTAATAEQGSRQGTGTTVAPWTCSQTHQAHIALPRGHLQMLYVGSHVLLLACRGRRHPGRCSWRLQPAAADLPW